MDEDTKKMIESGILEVGVHVLAAAVGEPRDDGISDDIQQLLSRLAKSEGLGDLTGLAVNIYDELRNKENGYTKF